MEGYAFYIRDKIDMVYQEGPKNQRKAHAKDGEQQFMNRGDFILNDRYHIKQLWPARVRNDLLEPETGG